MSTRIRHLDAMNVQTAYVITYDAMIGDAVSTSSSSQAAEVGARITALREAMDLSLRDLAERSGVSAPMLSPGRARRDEPDAVGRRARSPPGSSSRLSQLLRLDEGEHVVVIRAGERRARERARAPRSRS